MLNKKRHCVDARVLTSGPEASGRNSATRRGESALPYFKTGVETLEDKCASDLFQRHGPQDLSAGTHSVKFLRHTGVHFRHAVIDGALDFRSDHTNRGNCMKLPNHGRRAVALLYGLLLLTVPAIYGQTPTTGDKNTQSNEPSTAAMVHRPSRANPAGSLAQRHGQRNHHEHDHRVQGELRLELHHNFQILRPRRRSGFRNADLAREPCSPRK